MSPRDVDDCDDGRDRWRDILDAERREFHKICRLKSGLVLYTAIKPTRCRTCREPISKGDFCTSLPAIPGRYVETHVACRYCRPWTADDLPERKVPKSWCKKPVEPVAPPNLQPAGPEDCSACAGTGLAGEVGQRKPCPECRGSGIVEVYVAGLSDDEDGSTFSLEKVTREARHVHR